MERRRDLRNSRYMQVLAFLSVLAAILMVRLLMLTTVEHSEWSDISENMTTRSIYVTAPRGEIYDRHGRLLAGNKQSFSVRMNGSGLTDEEINENCVKLLEILDANGDTIEDDFPIVINGNHYEYTYQQDIIKWLEKMDFNTKLTAEEAFNALRSLFGIDPALDRYQAQEVLQQQYSQFPPISVSDMEYTYDMEQRTFLQRYFGNDEEAQNMTAKEAFKAIREEMEIDPKLPDKEARRIMVIRDAIDATGYSQYMPVVVAKNVSEKTVMVMEERKQELPGMEVISETTRYYPNGHAASHVLGYVGVITEEEATAGEDYELDAIVGKQGIEGNMEKYLKGTNGRQLVQVNARGELVKVLQETEIEKGQDIYLTIDLDLQQAAEDGLEKTIRAAKWGGTVHSDYGNSRIAEAAPHLVSGSVVAIDVDTHEILAMANYPDYDPNLFSEGISQDDWDSLQSQNLRDPLAAAPMYNMATMSTVQPGSTFKPITATAALQQGLNPNMYLADNGAIELDGHTFACILWNIKEGNHHPPLNLATALEVSCNYYFYDIATGLNWANNKSSLGYDISYKDITHYAEQYGLGKPSGVEIEEAVSSVPSEENRKQILKTNLSYVLYANAEDYFEENVYKTPELLDANIETIKGWLDRDSLDWDDLYDDLMPEVGIKKSSMQRVGEMILYDYYPQASWNVGDTFNLCIGQGENAYTPLQICNYIATLGNGGYYNEVTLIKSIEDHSITRRDKGEMIDIDDPGYIEDIMKGMRLVGSGEESSVSEVFEDLDVSVAAKTGTAERSGKINPPSEVDYMKEHLSSFLPNTSWETVEKEMNRLMDEYPETYSSKDAAVRKAVINLSDGKLNGEKLDVFKAGYDPFAWVVALAPADDPEIAVVAMLPQGVKAANAAPIVKEVIGAYFEKQDEDYKDFTIVPLVE